VIGSQAAAVERWSRASGVDLVDVYVERGSDDSQFAAMLDNATAADRPYDIVVVHTLSRLSRDLSRLIVSCPRLDRAGVELVSITDGEFEAVDRLGAAMINSALKRE
jgi:site-specific DNA recombinase